MIPPSRFVVNDTRIRSWRMSSTLSLMLGNRAHSWVILARIPVGQALRRHSARGPSVAPGAPAGPMGYTRGGVDL